MWYYNTCIHHMNLDYISNLPIDLRREIYLYIPKRTCMICEKKILTYYHVKEMSICSMHCCVILNTRVLKDVIVYNAYVRLHNLMLTLNYIFFKVSLFAIASIFSTFYIMIIACILKKLIFISSTMIWYIVNCLFPVFLVTP